jgi:hypothetical protein
MGLLGVARANTSVGASPETFLLLLLNRAWSKVRELPSSIKHVIVSITVPMVYPEIPVAEGLLSLFQSKSGLMLHV